MNEFDFIRRYLAPLSSNAPGSLGLTDDAALVRIAEGRELVLTKDAMVAGVHFFASDPPDLIARKLLRTNLSDLAAMGATPESYLLALMLPGETSEEWLRAFVGGLAADQKQFGLSLLGGDTVRTPGPLSLSATMIGRVPFARALTRSGASAGDGIYVSGTIGDAALGLRVAKGELGGSNPSESELDARFSLLQRYYLPEPRLELGRALRGFVTSCMDISDGLMQDLGHIAELNGLGAIVHWTSLPLSQAAVTVLPFVEKPREAVLAGGDDYELLFTAPPGFEARFAGMAAVAELPITRIGEMTQEPGVRLLGERGGDIRLGAHGYRHF